MAISTIFNRVGHLAWLDAEVEGVHDGEMGKKSTLAFVAVVPASDTIGLPWFYGDVWWPWMVCRTVFQEVVA